LKDHSVLFDLFEAVRRPGTARLTWQVVLTLAVLAVTFLVYATGGIKYVYSHFMYLPILMTAIFFGWRGGLLAALTGGLLLGPWMPINVATGEMQQASNWLFRTGSFAFVGLLAGTAFDLLDRQMEQLRWHFSHDSRTALPNRNSLYQKITEWLGAEKPFLVAAVGVDNYFTISNALGSEIGDRLIQELVSRFADTLGKRALLFQLQSDMLAILLPEGSGPWTDPALTTVRDIIRDSVDIDGVPVYVDVSLGVARYPIHSREAKALVQQATVAMHHARRIGRHYAAYDKSIDSSSRQSLALLGQIPIALRENQFQLYYQPKVNITRDAIVGVEALLRWHHPQQGVLQPDRYIVWAEETGLIRDITRWVLATALEQQAEWQAQGLSIPMAINLSARNLQEPDLLSFFQQEMAMRGLAPGMLEVEVTESAVMADVSTAARLLGRLRELGIRVSIDDFGTGHASLAYLKDLPVDAIKIDRIFIRNLSSDQADWGIVQAAVALARNLGLDVVAEGVEDRTALALLREMGCTIVQGYLLSRPLPASELVPRLRAAQEGKSWLAAEPLVSSATG
jgi:diguanylate cyclase (GGDEF)-like protein